jgi:hypothetical protein
MIINENGHGNKPKAPEPKPAVKQPVKKEDNK